MENRKCRKLESYSLTLFRIAIVAMIILPLGKSLQRFSNSKIKSYMHRNLDNDKVNDRNIGNSILFEDLKDSRGKFIAKLQVFAKESSMLQQKECNDLSQLLKNHVNSMDKFALSQTVSLLGEIRMNSPQLQCEKNSRMILQSLAKFDYSAEEIACIFVGLGRMRVTWDGLLQEVTFLQSVSRNWGPGLSLKVLSDFIWSMGLLGARWKTIPRELQSSMISGFESNGGQLNAFSLSSILWAWAKMGLQFDSLSFLAQTLVSKKVQEHALIFSPQQSSKVIWALGAMGAKVSLISLQTIEELLLRVGNIKKSQMGNAVSASQTFIGLSKLGVSFNNLSRTAQVEVLQQLVRVCQSYNAKGIANSIWAVGSMGLSQGQLSSEVQEILFASAGRVLPECSSWAATNTFWGISKMKFSWARLPRALRDSMMTNVVRLENEMNDVDTGALLWSLGELDCPLDTAPRYFSDAIFGAILSNIDKMKAQELSRTLWGLSGACVSWNMLSNQAKWAINSAIRRVGPQMSKHDLANCVYAITVMCFDSEDPGDVAFRGVHEALLDLVRLAKLKSGVVEQIEQLRIFCHYLKVMGFVGDVKRIPIELLNISEREGESAVEVGERSSKLQSRVTQSLREALELLSTPRRRIDLSPEMSSFNGVFPVDATVSINGKVAVFLEVDGPHHFLSDGRLRRKDKLKETLYRRNHPNCIFHRVHFDEENKIGASTIASEIAVLIEEAALSQENIVGNLLNAAQNSLSNFFSWGLRNSKDLS